MIKFKNYLLDYNKYRYLVTKSMRNILDDKHHNYNGDYRNIYDYFGTLDSDVVFLSKDLYALYNCLSYEGGDLITLLSKKRSMTHEYDYHDTEHYIHDYMQHTYSYESAKCFLMKEMADCFSTDVRDSSFLAPFEICVERIGSPQKLMDQINELFNKFLFYLSLYQERLENKFLNSMWTVFYETKETMNNPYDNRRRISPYDYLKKEFYEKIRVRCLYKEKEGEDNLLKESGIKVLYFYTGTIDDKQQLSKLQNELSTFSNLYANSLERSESLSVILESNSEIDCFLDQLNYPYHTLNGFNIINLKNDFEFMDTSKLYQTIDNLLLNINSLINDSMTREGDVIPSIKSIFQSRDVDMLGTQKRLLELLYSIKQLRIFHLNYSEDKSIEDFYSFVINNTNLRTLCIKMGTKDHKYLFDSDDAVGVIVRMEIFSRCEVFSILENNINSIIKVIDKIEFENDFKHKKKMKH